MIDPKEALAVAKKDKSMNTLIAYEDIAELGSKARALYQAHCDQENETNRSNRNRSEVNLKKLVSEVSSFHKSRVVRRKLKATQKHIDLRKRQLG